MRPIHQNGKFLFFRMSFTCIYDRSNVDSPKSTSVGLAVKLFKWNKPILLKQNPIWCTVLTTVAYEQMQTSQTLDDALKNSFIECNPKLHMEYGYGLSAWHLAMSSIQLSDDGVNKKPMLHLKVDSLSVCCELVSGRITFTLISFAILVVNTSFQCVSEKASQIDVFVKHSQ